MRRSQSSTIAKPVAAKLVNDGLLQKWPLPSPPVDGDKEGRGRILIIGGARQMPGAVLLAATAALRVGAGKLQIATVAGVAVEVGIAIPEAFVHSLPEARDGGFNTLAEKKLRAICLSARAIVLGPGMIENRALAPLVLSTLSRLSADQTVVLDAGALTVLSEHRHRLPKFSCELVITPHAGEMAKLLGQEKQEIKRDALQTVQQAAIALRAVTVLKGAETFVSDGKVTYRNEAGNPGLATSGSGDTLAGLIAGLIARGAPSLQAAVWGVYLHARAGDVLAKRLGPLGYLPRELLAEIPALMARCGRPRTTSRS